MKTIIALTIVIGIAMAMGAGSQRVSKQQQLLNQKASSFFDYLVSEEPLYQSKVEYLNAALRPSLFGEEAWKRDFNVMRPRKRALRNLDDKFRGDKELREITQFFKDKIDEFEWASYLAKEITRTSNTYCAIGDLSGLELQGQNLGFTVWCFDKSLLGRKFGIEKPKYKGFRSFRRKERRDPFDFEFLEIGEPEDLQIPIITEHPIVQRAQPSLQRLMARKAIQEKLLSESDNVAQKISNSPEQLQLGAFGFSQGLTLGGGWGGFGGNQVETSTKVRSRKMTQEEVDEKIKRDKEMENDVEVTMEGKDGKVHKANGKSGVKASELVNTKRRSQTYEESGYDEVTGFTTKASNPNPNKYQDVFSRGEGTQGGSWSFGGWW